MRAEVYPDAFCKAMMEGTVPYLSTMQNGGRIRITEPTSNPSSDEGRSVQAAVPILAELKVQPVLTLQEISRKLGSISRNFGSIYAAHRLIFSHPFMLLGFFEKLLSLAILKLCFKQLCFPYFQGSFLDRK